MPSHLPPVRFFALPDVHPHWGTNFVAVRFSNQELPPFWGAGLRFAAAALVLSAAAALGRFPLPRGRALAGALA